MLIERILFRYFCAKGDRANRKLLNIPGDVERKVNISYGKRDKWNLLDVYYPKAAKDSRGADKPLPAIINVHGGGYVYGTKEESRYYCADLARRGFAVVSFSYRLAPRAKFPTPVIETNQAMGWICAHAADYNIDTNNIFITGDSAGAQIASQYATIVTHPKYAALFNITVPAFRLRAIALNCGMYSRFHTITSPMPGLLKDYFGKEIEQPGERLNVFRYINKNYPPAFIMSAANDFLLPHARPLFEHLQKHGVESVLKIYGTAEQKEIGHVFHLNILSPLARECNNEECEFFKKHINGGLK